MNGPEKQDSPNYESKKITLGEDYGRSAPLCQANAKDSVQNPGNGEIASANMVQKRRALVKIKKP